MHLSFHGSYIDSFPKICTTICISIRNANNITGILFNDPAKYHVYAHEASMITVAIKHIVLPTPLQHLYLKLSLYCSSKYLITTNLASQESSLKPGMIAEITFSIAFIFSLPVFFSLLESI